MALGWLDLGTRLPSRQSSSKIDRPCESVIRDCAEAFSPGHHRGLFEVITRPARKHDYLKTSAFLFEQCAEPVHAAFTTLDKLVVEDDDRL
jgi:hypothetical protein